MRIRLSPQPIPAGFHHAGEPAEHIGNRLGIRPAADKNSGWAVGAADDTNAAGLFRPANDLDAVLFAANTVGNGLAQSQDQSRDGHHTGGFTKKFKHRNYLFSSYFLPVRLCVQASGSSLLKGPISIFEPAMGFRLEFSAGPA